MEINCVVVCCPKIFSQFLIPAVSEVFEETGYSVKVEDLVKVRSFKSGVGTAASTQNIYYVEVCQCSGARSKPV